MRSRPDHRVPLLRSPVCSQQRYSSGLHGSRVPVAVILFGSRGMEPPGVCRYSGRGWKAEMGLWPILVNARMVNASMAMNGAIGQLQLARQEFRKLLDGAGDSAAARADQQGQWALESAQDHLRGLAADLIAVDSQIQQLRREMGCAPNAHTRPRVVQYRSNWVVEPARHQQASAASTVEVGSGPVAVATVATVRGLPLSRPPLHGCSETGYDSECSVWHVPSSVPHGYGPAM